MGIKREIQLIALLLVLIVLLVKAVEFFKVDVIEADASNFVLEDLADKYPGASTEVMSIRQKHTDSGNAYFEVKARVTADAESPCPERMHIYYNYPEQNFVPQPTEVITQNCEVCTEGICTLAFPEEAVIASHTFAGTEAVRSYLSRYTTALPQTTENKDSWSVMWDTPLALKYYVVELDKDGSLLGIDEITKN